MEENVRKIPDLDIEKQEKLMDALLEEDIEEVCDMVDTILEEELNLKDNSSPHHEEISISPASHKTCESIEHSFVEPCFGQPTFSTPSLTETTDLNATEGNAGFKNKIKSKNKHIKNKVRSSKAKYGSARHKNTRSSNASLYTAFEASSLCIYCYESGHMIVSCPQFLHMNIKDRIGYIEDRKRCYSCFKKHLWEDCPRPSVCRHCQASHNSILCRYSANGSTSYTHDYCNDHFDLYSIKQSRFICEKSTESGSRRRRNVAVESNYKKPCKDSGPRSGCSYVAVESNLYCSNCRETDHEIIACPKFLWESVSARRRIANTLSLCYRCLGKHNMKCKVQSSCLYCKGNHHSLLCFKHLLYPYRIDEQMKRWKAFRVNEE